METAKRFTSSELAKIQIYGRKGASEGVIKNLSETGAYIELIDDKRTPQKGDLVHISIDLKEVGKNYEVDAEVIWNKRNGFGVRFVKRSELLQKLVDRAKNLGS